MSTPHRHPEVVSVRTSLRKVTLAIDRVYASGLLSSRSGVDLERGLHQVVFVMGERAPLRVSEVAEALGLSSPTVSRHVTRLIQAGVALKEDDASDGRASRIRLTEQGRMLHDALVRTWDEVFDQALDGVGEDLETFQRSLANFAAALSDLAFGSSPSSVAEEPTE